ncbi:FRG domain-containing protein [Candidatus Lokiarchaeum ossiferum]|uniref:FRG domain-containing protein n=1 Tax=Candidatus Lokiarchaeum ossiferum TaxID=2951803 RepID=UPI00352E7B65
MYPTIQNLRDKKFDISFPDHAYDSETTLIILEPDTINILFELAEKLEGKGHKEGQAGGLIFRGQNHQYYWDPISGEPKWFITSALERNFPTETEQKKEEMNLINSSTKFSYYTQRMAKHQHLHSGTRLVDFSTSMFIGLWFSALDYETSRKVHKTIPLKHKDYSSVWILGTFRLVMDYTKSHRIEFISDENLGEPLPEPTPLELAEILFEISRQKLKNRTQMLGYFTSMNLEDARKDIPRMIAQQGWLVFSPLFGVPFMDAMMNCNDSIRKIKTKEIIKTAKITVPKDFEILQFRDNEHYVINYPASWNEEIIERLETRGITWKNLMDV